MKQATYRILLLDDDPDDRSLARVVLTSELEHFEINEISDAVTFAQACARHDFDLVILEQQLHWSEGLAVLGALKEEWPELPVIMFTRSGDEEVALKAARLGVQQYLVKKPSTFLRLPSEVEAALEQARSRRAPPPPYGRRPVAPIAAVPPDLPADASFFAAVASHELQEPLRAIERSLRTLHDEHGGALDPEGTALLERAAASARRLQVLLRDLQSLSRVEGGEPHTLEDVDAGELLDQTLGNLEAAIAESGARVTHAPLPRIQGDPVQIVQLLQNLIGNAIKFRGDREPQIHVAAARTDGEWVFSVHDNCIGMEPAEAEAIFTSFKRLHPEVPGSGLGLSICKRIVERHGGNIWAKSEPGQGSTFYFTLPRPSSQERPEGTPFASRRSF